MYLKGLHIKHRLDLTRATSYNHRMKHNKPVILQLLPTLVSGGVERGTIDVANALYEQGMTPLVASNGGPLVERLEASGARHITLPIHKKNLFVMLRMVGAIEELCKTEGVDIIHARSRVPAWAGYFAAKRLGIPFITTFHSYHSHKTALKRFYNGVMGKGAHVIAISHFMKAHMMDVYGIAERKITIIPRGTDIDYFNPDRVSKEDREHLRDVWGVPKEKRLILVPGRLSRKKGQRYLLNALAALDSSIYHCVFLGQFTGHGRYLKQVQKLIDRYELPVTFQSHTDDMATAYAASDVVIYPSIIPEAFGRVPSESQAMRRPVITLNHGGAAETVQHNQTGLLVPPKDIKAMTHAVKQLLDATLEENMAMGEKGRAYISKHFSLEGMTQSTLAIYNSVLSRD